MEWIIVKAAILTINDYNNYGNRLQNYAVQEILKNHHFEVETIRHELDVETLYRQYGGQNSNNKLIRKISTLLKLSNKDRIKLIKNKFMSKDMKLLKNNRINRFKEFSNEMIKETNFTISELKIPETLASSYDLFVTGSDQVWNPHFRYGSAIDFLTFAPTNKRLALSASFGVAEIPSKFQSNYKRWLNEMPFISVREDAGAAIVKENTGRDVPVLIDPTLMLDKEEWLSISSVHQMKPKSAFLLTYFLGEVAEAYLSTIKKIAKENNLQIVNLADPNSKEYYDAHPGEFIDYINSAEVFCTDSFHGVIFSTIMYTPVIIFTRGGNTPSMNSRIETLMNTLNIKDRHYNHVCKTKDWFGIVNRDSEILNKREEMNRFLNTYLEQ